MAHGDPDSLGGLADLQPWDARLARRLVAPLAGTRVSPNHLTTIRLAVGLAAVAAFVPGSYGWSNLGGLLLVVSNFLDHTDGELARLTGKTSRFGHFYDLASDALVTILLFLAMGIGVGARSTAMAAFYPAVLGAIAGTAVAAIFYLRMRLEELAGKDASRQPSIGRFETEDILYLIPLVTLCNGLTTMLVLAFIFAPIFALWVFSEYRRVSRRPPPAAPCTDRVPQ